VRKGSSGPSSGGKHDGVGEPDRLRDGIQLGHLEVAHDRLTAGGANLVRMVGFANQRHDLVAALVGQACEKQRNLPMSTRDRQPHGP
jgi:hypothetical protein